MACARHHALRACYIRREGWLTPLDGHQPRCADQVTLYAEVDPTLHERTLSGSVETAKRPTQRWRRCVDPLGSARHQRQQSRTAHQLVPAFRQLQLAMDGHRVLAVIRGCPEAVNLVTECDRCIRCSPRLIRR